MEKIGLTKRHQQAKEESEDSLTTVLNDEQQNELSLLVASILAAMRKTIILNFDINVEGTQGIAKDLATRNEDIPSQGAQDSLRKDVVDADAQRNLREKRDQELRSPEVRDIKQHLLNFFDSWRGKVITRISETINSNAVRSQVEVSDAPEQMKEGPTDIELSDEPDNLHEDAAAASLEKYFPPFSTPLSRLPEKSRVLILHSLLLLLLSLEHYVAPSRVLLLYITSSLRLPLKTLILDEEKMARGLLEAAKHISAASETQKKVDESKSSRKWQVGLASVAGAALIGVTGGLAAPLVAAGVGSVMGGLGLGATAAAGYLGSVAGSSIIVGGLFGAYGGRMTGQMMDNYAREVQDFAFLPVPKNGEEIEAKNGDEVGGDMIAHEAKAVSKKLGEMDLRDRERTDTATASDEAPLQPVQDQEDKEGVESSASRRLRVTIGISGWLTSKAEVVNPWKVIGHNSEVFALRWELEALLNLGNSLDAMVGSAAWGYASSEIIQRTIFAELASALWPVSLLQVARVVDNPFSIAKARADKAGRVLADALINKAQGERPVTLIGYSLGARVIYSCLTSLASRHAFGLIESVVLIGAPTPSTTADWRMLRSVVASRLVNVYSVNDYILGFLYRTSSVQYGVAGLQKIEGLPGVENVDVSQIVDGHLRYRYLVGSILKQIGFEDINIEAVKEEEASYRKMLEAEKKKTYSEKATREGQKVLDQNPVGFSIGDDQPEELENSSEAQTEREKAGAEAEAAEMEAQVKQKTEKGMLQSAWGYLPTRLQGKIGSSAPEKQVGEKSDKPAQYKADTGELAAGKDLNVKDKDSSWADTLTGGFLGGR